MTRRKPGIKDFPNPLYAQFLNFRPRKGDLRRATILEGTIDCISTLGIEQTTYESIGKKTGMQRAHVAYYFKDRDDIIEKAIQFCVANAQNQTVEALKKAKTDQEKLIAFIEGTFEWAERHPRQAAVMILLYHYTTYKKHFRELHTKVRDLGAQRITTIIRPLLSSKKSKQAPLVAKTVQAVLTGHLIDYTTTNSSVDLTKLRKRCVEDVLGIVGLT